MNLRRTRFTTTDITLTGVFSALWAVLSLTLGPLSVGLLGLPILHDFGAFFTLLLVVWATSRFGTASIVGMVGSAVALVIGANLAVIGFMIAAIVLDVMMGASRHELHANVRDVSVVALATMVSAYTAGAVIGILFMGRSAYWSLTVWGGWHMAGGILALIVTLPVLAMLEKANVKGLANA